MTRKIFFMLGAVFFLMSVNCSNDGNDAKDGTGGSGGTAVDGGNGVDVGPSTNADSGIDSDSGATNSGHENGDAGGDDSGERDTGARDSGDDAPVVDLSDGPIEGFSAGSTFGFVGIPFAAPPIGEHRWRPPQPVESWDDVRDVKEPQFACIQSGIGFFNPVGETSEDCLYLNVWTPDLTPSEPLPVMVWLHGGANSTGSAFDLAEAGADELAYNGQYLIEAAPRPVVVVTINYRLNRFGFLAHAGLTAEEGTSGNYGLMDQQAALRWVRDNISAFGGNPENVTLFGVSAGGLDTCLQVMAKDNAGLIHRAIMESAGPCYPDRWELDDAEASGADFAEFVGCTGSNDAEVVNCLRGLSTEEILVSAPPSDPLPGGVIYQDPPRWQFGPIIDGVFLPQQVADIIASDQHVKIPMIIGTNDREGDLFHGPLLGGTPPAGETEYWEALGRFLGDAADAVADAYPLSDFDATNDALSAVTTDSVFVCPAWNLARALVGQGGTVFKYNYTHELGFSSLGGIGPTHGTEVALVWGWAEADSAADVVTESDRNVGATIVDYWTRFAHTGDPNGDDAPEWPLFETDTESEVVLDESVRTASGRMTDKCDFWATVQ